MNNLLKKYIEEYDIERINILGRNIVNNNPDDRESIELYIGFLLELANSLPMADERREYLSQARVILSFVGENANLDETYIDWLASIQAEIDQIEDKIADVVDRKIEFSIQEINSQNSKALIEIHGLIDKLHAVRDQESFDKCMQQFIAVDKSIDKDYLSEEDQQRYDELSKMCSETISERLLVIERNKNVDYNNEAVKSFKLAYKEFRDFESQYMSDSYMLVNMLKEKMFGFDSDRLFPETIMYFQDIYKNIFDKVTDEGKELMTRASIESYRA